MDWKFMEGVCDGGWWGARWWSLRVGWRPVVGQSLWRVPLWAGACVARRCGVADLTWGPWICPLIGLKGSARKPCPICNFKGQIPRVKSATVLGPRVTRVVGWPCRRDRFGCRLLVVGRQLLLLLLFFRALLLGVGWLRLLLARSWGLGPVC